MADIPAYPPSLNAIKLRGFRYIVYLSYDTSMLAVKFDRSSVINTLRRGA
jgi:hypothetical protein